MDQLTLTESQEMHYHFISCRSSQNLHTAYLTGCLLPLTGAYLYGMLRLPAMF